MKPHNTPARSSRRPALCLVRPSRGPHWDFSPHDQPHRLMAYGLCRRHRLNQATVDAIDERVGAQLAAEQN